MITTKKMSVSAMTLMMAMGTSQMSFAQDSSDTQSEDIVVATGTLIRRKAQEDRASPILTVSEADLSSIGAKNIADLTQTLTINTGSENNPDAFTQNVTTGTSNINLRGLGVQSTLVLLDGRRQVLSAATTNAGFQFVDTSSLVPLIAIENVDILKDGASATYGSDAVAGVANFTTVKNFEGVRLNGQYQIVAGEGNADEIVLQGLVGKNFKRGNITGAISYIDRSPLTTLERRLSEPADDTSALGNPGSFVGLGGPLGPLPILDPGCEAAGGIPQIIVPAAALQLPFDGGTCGFDFGDFFNLVADEERITGLVKADFDITDNIRWDGEFTYADNEAIRGNSPSFPFLLGGFVPVDHPDSIFTGPLQALAPGGSIFLGRAIGNGGDVSPNITTSETWRISTGLEGDFNENYNWRLSYTQGENNHVVATEDTLADAFVCALDGFRDAADCGDFGIAAGTFFNPFATSFTTSPNSPEVLDAIIGTAVRDLTSELRVIDAVVSGEIGDSGLAGAIGVQYRDEDYTARFDEDSNADNFGFIIGDQDFEGSQDVISIFGELNYRFWDDRVELQGALRFEDYGGEIGSTVDPKVAILFRPEENISLRGSFSTSFRAPTVYQQFGQQTALNQITDPLSGAQTFGGARTFGNEDLSPEQSTAFNVGATWEPIENLKLNLDAYSFDFTDVIIAENFQAVVNSDPTNPDLVVRNAAGSIVQVNTNFVNAASLQTNGFDYGISYEADLGFATLIPFFEGTRVTEYNLEDPQAGLVDGLGNRNFTNFGTSVPENRFNTGFNLISDGHRLDVFGRFIDGYDDDQNPGETVDSQFTLDARYSFNFAEFFDVLGDATAINVGVINAFDEDPPQVFTNGGFDSKVHDPRGRLLYAGIDLEF